MHLVSCTNTHHCDVIDLVNHGMVKNTKTWISWERNIIFLWNKKILNLCFRWLILRSYCFAAEVVGKPLTLFTKLPQVQVQLKLPPQAQVQSKLPSIWQSNFDQSLIENIFKKIDHHLWKRYGLKANYHTVLHSVARACVM